MYYHRDDTLFRRTAQNKLFRFHQRKAQLRLYLSGKPFFGGNGSHHCTLHYRPQNRKSKRAAHLRRTESYRNSIHHELQQRGAFIQPIQKSHGINTYLLQATEEQETQST